MYPESNTGHNLKGELRSRRGQIILEYRRAEYVKGTTSGMRLTGIGIFADWLGI